MKEISRVLATVALFGSVAVTAVGCGSIGIPGGVGAAVPKEDTGKALVDEARGYIAELQGEYVVAMGIVDEATAKVEALAEVPEGVNLKQLKVKELTSALQECWDTPVTKAKELADAGVDLKDAATHFNQKEGLRDLKHVQAASGAAYKNVTNCAPASLTKAKALPKAANDMTRQFIDMKVQQVDELRKLAMSEIPARGEGLYKTAAGIVPKLAEVFAKLQAQVQNPMSDQGLLKGSLAEFAGLQKEVEGMAKKVQTDAKGLANTATQMPAKVTKAFSSFK